MARKKRRNVRQKSWGGNQARSRRTQKKQRTFKERFLTLAIWVLGLMNLVLVASLVSDFFGSPNEQPASINLPAAEAPAGDRTPATRQTTQPITVEVLNACGAQGLAHNVTEFLRSRNFDVVNVGNYEGGFDLDQSYVLDRVSVSNENALAVAKVLGVDLKRVKPQLDRSRQLMVTVLLGKDYKKLKAYPEIRRMSER